MTITDDEFHRTLGLMALLALGAVLLALEIVSAGRGAHARGLKRGLHLAAAPLLSIFALTLTLRFGAGASPW